MWVVAAKHLVQRTFIQRFNCILFSASGKGRILHDSNIRTFNTNVGRRQAFGMGAWPSVAALPMIDVSQSINSCLPYLWTVICLGVAAKVVSQLLFISPSTFNFPKRRKLLRLKNEKVSERDGKIQKFLSAHAPKTAEIEAFYNAVSNSSVLQIVGKITETKEWTALEVMKAVCWKACQSHALTNCLTEVMFDEALSEAAKLDLEFAQNPVAKGPLHGVPISLKDNYAVKGVDGTCGLIHRSFTPAKYTSSVVEVLVAAGGIPFAKTNVPQTMLSLECSNPLWGQTHHPLKRNFSPGGSSGGEAALIGSGGSILGMGNDIGGSLRIPSVFCGIYAIKPTFGRFSSSATPFASSGQDSIRPTNGPMARSIEDLEIAMTVLNQAKDYYCPPLGWNASECAPKKTKYRIGYISGLSFLDPLPYYERCMLETSESLRNEGHEIVPFSIPIDLEGVLAFYAILTADSFVSIRKKLAGTHFGHEPVETTVKKMLLLSSLPNFVKKAIFYVLKLADKDSTFADILNVSGPKSVSDLWHWCLRKNIFLKKAMSAFEESKCDFFIFPGSVCASFEDGLFAHIQFVTSYTLIWNVLDLPVGVMPVSKISASDAAHCAEIVNGKKQTKSSKGLSFLHKVLKRYGLYDVQPIVDFPLGIQVITPRRFEEEKLIRFMKEIQRCTDLKNTSD